MNPLIKLLASASCFSIVLGGCTARQYDMDSSMGIAVHENLAAQIANPNGTPPTGPQGLAGGPSKAVMDRYVNSFMTPPPPANAFSIGLGSGGGLATSAPASSGTAP
jgi:hypothetical protein